MEGIVDFEIAELIRFYGSIVGTPGIEDRVNVLCNDNIMKLLKVVQPKLIKLTSGIIIK